MTSTVVRVVVRNLLFRPWSVTNAAIRIEHIYLVFAPIDSVPHNVFFSRRQCECVSLFVVQTQIDQLVQKLKKYEERYRDGREEQCR